MDVRAVHFKLLVQDHELIPSKVGSLNDDHPWGRKIIPKKVKTVGNLIISGVALSRLQWCLSTYQQVIQEKLLV